MAIALVNKRKLEQKFPRKSYHEIQEHYESIRDELKTGDLIFFSGDHWLSGLIRWRSRSAWSHVGIVVKIEEMNRVFLVESTLETGVRLIPMSFVVKNYDGNNNPYVGRVAWARHNILVNSADQLRKVKEFCLDNLTKQYDNKEYFRIMWRTLVGSKEIFNDNKFTCAEYVLEAYRYAGLKLPKERGYFISPGAFWRQDGVEMKGIII
ncbi:Permuted papain-like amidase enzyme, YaeF/YiiX, C92 family [Spirosomataceae bacterium TFI 002]|nr:Permuted papain-like amidase enzyme, YaeF/YiiX, C92 family [Spirosomataceae bacterium TFI 002]